LRGNGNDVKKRHDGCGDRVKDSEERSEPTTRASAIKWIYWSFLGIWSSIGRI
jgi:hypothetical protein